MHNHNGKKNSSMVWMMSVCVLFLVVLFFAGGKLFSGGYFGPILIGVFVVAHIWMMFKGHGGHKDDGAENKKDENNKNKHGGCCH